MLEDLKTLVWFLKKGPKFYATMFALIFRKFRKDKDLGSKKTEIEWCKKQCISFQDCADKLGFSSDLKDVFSVNFIQGINDKLKNSKSNFGGQGHVQLLYAVCEHLKVEKVVETGVAYGWSSAAILKSISKRTGKLISVDMPMIKQTDYHLIGVAVEKKLFKYWDLIREPDKFGLKKAITKHNNIFDLAHYDSDKSYYGRKWSQLLIWKFLRPGGIFISDDIEDNSAFREFVEENKFDYSVLKFEGKFVGLIKKY